jgi:GNAT superfamily N-acetyltransferase
VHVHEIGAEAFRKYAIDLLERLGKMADEDRPAVWIAVGGSGDHVVKEIANVGLTLDERAYQWLRNIIIVSLAYDSQANNYHFEDAADAAKVAGSIVMMVDSVVNSGTTMLGALALLQSAGSSPKHILSYATAVRVTASFVPNVFSVPIGPNDRVFLPWHQTRPNNRMTMIGTFRDLSVDDLGKDPIASDQDFMNRVHWKDRWYSMKSDGSRRVIVCDVNGKIASFINFTVDTVSGDVHIDEVATDKAYTGRKLAGALLRFAETYARATGCVSMSLWSHESVVTMYEKLTYKRTGQTIQCGSDGSYLAMSRPLGSSKVALLRWLADKSS